MADLIQYKPKLLDRIITGIAKRYVTPENFENVLSKVPFIKTNFLLQEHIADMLIKNGKFEYINEKFKDFDLNRQRLIINRILENGNITIPVIDALTEVLYIWHISTPQMQIANKDLLPLMLNKLETYKDENGIIIGNNYIGKAWQYSTKEVQLANKEILPEILDISRMLYLNNGELISNKNLIKIVWNNTTSKVQDEKVINLLETLKTYKNQDGKVISDDGVIEVIWNELSTKMQDRHIKNALETIKSYTNENGEIIKNDEALIELWGNTAIEVQYKNKELLPGILNLINNNQDEEKRNRLIENLWKATSSKVILQKIDLYLKTNKIDDNNVKLAEHMIKDMYRRNDEIFKTLKPQIINQKYIKAFGRARIQELALYSQLQKILLKLDDSKVRFLEELVTSTEKEEWQELFGKVVQSFDNPEYDNIYQSLSEKDVLKAISKYDIQNLINIVCNKNNVFNIRNLDDVKNYNSLRRKVCKDILNKNDNNLPISIKSMSDDDRVRFATLQMLYGIDNNEAKKILNLYGKDIINAKKTYSKMDNDNKKVNLSKIPNEVAFLHSLDNILNGDIEKVKGLKVVQNEYRIPIKFNVEAKLKKYYANMYNQTLYRLEDKEPIAITEFENKKISIYNAGTEFNMNVSVLGAYNATYEMQKNYKLNWNMPKMASRHFCTSYIGNNLLGMAMPKCEDKVLRGPILGFVDLVPESLVASASRDIISEGHRNYVFGSLKADYTPDFRSPKEMINATRHQYNEMNYERMYINKNGILKKQQPSYLIYMTECSDFRKYEKEDSWRETKKAATQFNIPIVIVDKMACAKNEYTKICDRLENLTNMDSNTLDVNLVRNMIIEFGNNRASFQYDSEIFNQYFSNSGYEKYLHAIVNTIKTNSKITATQEKVCFDELTRTINNEYENINRPGGGVSASKEIKKFNDIYTKIKDEINLDEKLEKQHSK